MYNEEIQKVTREVFVRVTELLCDKIYKIILYGSYARGDFDSESDIDIMILINGTDEDVKIYRKKVREIANDVGLDNDILVSLSIKTKQSFEEWADTLVFYKNVINEGVTLYGWFIRSNSDYDDYTIIDKEDVKEQVENAEKFCDIVKEYLLKRYNNEYWQ